MLQETARAFERGMRDASIDVDRLTGEQRALMSMTLGETEIYGMLAERRAASVCT